ncbi:hypothetical protein [Paracoccus aestuariivivens]|uniref:Uncharacterized protein n=1 Tax=Paracoccus aestuariivivens TaxID=1820333 RepID=A0A6L6JCQ9_9RHOB|nr:hypothetical protein [Paracoccus aestuariivivens]MTH79993.1 hypothetical protein [Paracoccus aestuariivivens]
MKTFEATITSGLPRNDNTLRRIMRFLSLSGAGYAPLVAEAKPESPTIVGYGLYL